MLQQILRKEKKSLIVGLRMFYKQTQESVKSCWKIFASIVNVRGVVTQQKWEQMQGGYYLLLCKGICGPKETSF